jgi:type IV pilus assembly protein PilX
MTYLTTHNNQKGATLIVALIMLLLLTIIGMASINDTNLQEKMAGNLREKNIAFQAAEAALRKGEETFKDKFVTLTSVTDYAEAQASTTFSEFTVPTDRKKPTYTVTKVKPAMPPLVPDTPGGGSIETDVGTTAPKYDPPILIKIDSTGYGLNSASQVTLRSFFSVPQLEP